MATPQNSTPGESEDEQMFPQVHDQEWFLGLGCGGSGVSGDFYFAHDLGGRDLCWDFTHCRDGDGDSEVQERMQNQLRDSVRIAAREALATIQKFESDRLTHGVDRICLYYSDVDGDWLDEFAEALHDRSCKLSDKDAAALQAIVLAKSKPGIPMF